MFRGICATGVALVLVALPMTASAAGGPVLSGVAVAAGTVTGPDGAAIGGATVDLYAWPSDAILRAMKPGQTVPTTLLATAATSATGAYTLRIPAASLKSAATDSGYANLEIYSPSGIWFFSYQTGSLPARAAAAVTVNFDAKSKWPCGYNTDKQPYGFSGFKLLKHLKPAWAVVGQGYIIKQRGTSGDWVNFKYTEGSSRSQASSLGVGISGYGIDAGYSTNGTHSSTASRTAGYPNSATNAWFRTEFSTALYRGSCYGLPNQTGVPRVKQHSPCPKKYGESEVHMCLWMVESTGWFGGTSTLHPSKAPATPGANCAPMQKGSSYAGDFGKAVQWSSGFNIGAAVGYKGVNLKASFGTTAQTGYDRNAVMNYKFKKAGWLCGTNAGPASAAILVARDNRA